MAEDQSKIDADAEKAMEQAEEDSWTAAQADYLLEKQGEKPVEDKKDDDDAGKGDDAGAGKKSDDDASKGGKDDKGKKSGEDEDDAGKKKDPVEDQPDNKIVRDHRAIAREAEADRKLTYKEVSEKVLKDVPRKLEDSEGNEIRTIEDVQQLRNPKTGKAFTEEEAGKWLLAASQHLNKKINEAEQDAERITDIQLAIKDQADNIREKYGDLFKSVPGLQKKVWALFEATLKTDDALELIVDMPVSMEDFYDLQLTPYMDKLAQLDEEEDKDKEAKAEAAKKKKEDAEKAKKQNRSDRSSIYTGGKSDDGMDEEEAAWAKAAKDYYEG